MSKFQIGITFTVISIINQYCKKVFEFSNCSLLQLIQIVCQVKIKTLKILIYSLFMFLAVEYPQQVTDDLLPFLRPSSVSSDSVGYLSSFFMSVGAVCGLEFPS